MAATILTASYVLDAEAYVRHGFGDDYQWWADTFTKLGGQSCAVTPSWLYGLPVGDLFMEVVGTQAALDFVEDRIGL